MLAVSQVPTADDDPPGDEAYPRIASECFGFKIFEITGGDLMGTEKAEDRVSVCTGACPAKGLGAIDPEPKSL